MARPEVFVVGSLNADLVVPTPRRPDPGQTVIGGDLATFPGGKGANQAVSVARLGGLVALLARVGDDFHGQLLRQALHAAGVADDWVLTTAGVPSGVALISVTPDGQNSIIVSPGANRRLTPADVEAAAAGIGTARVALMQLEVPIATVERAGHVAAEAGVRVVLNLAPAHHLSARVMPLLDPMVLNEGEAAFLIGTPVNDLATALAATAALLELGPRSAVITLGAAGAVYAEAGDVPAHVPAPQVTPVDTTGAGDAFMGALALELARDATLADAVNLAVRVGAAAVRVAGAQSSLPTRAELLKL